MTRKPLWCLQERREDELWYTVAGPFEFPEDAEDESKKEKHKGKALRVVKAFPPLDPRPQKRRRS